MDHYAADENYFSEEGIQEGHDALLAKLDAKKRRSKRRARQRAAQRRSPASDRRRRHALLLFVSVTALCFAAGWLATSLLL
jgi:uncharacterized membrane protein YgcG